MEAEAAWSLHYAIAGQIAFWGVVAITIAFGAANSYYGNKWRKSQERNLSLQKGYISSSNIIQDAGAEGSSKNYRM